MNAAKLAAARDYLESRGLSPAAVREREHRATCPTCIRDRELGRIKTVLTNFQAEAAVQARVTPIKRRRKA